VCLFASQHKIQWDKVPFSTFKCYCLEPNRNGILQLQCGNASQFLRPCSDVLIRRLFHAEHEIGCRQHKMWHLYHKTRKSNKIFGLRLEIKYGSFFALRSSSGKRFRKLCWISEEVTDLILISDALKLAWPLFQRFTPWLTHVSVPKIKISTHP